MVTSSITPEAFTAIEATLPEVRCGGPPGQASAGDLVKVPVRVLDRLVALRGIGFSRAAIP
jgi:hypothetical protein